MYLMVPAVVLLVLIDLLPLLIGLVNSFRRLEFSTLEHWFTAPWIGLQNYSQAWSGGGGLSVSALSAIWHSIEFSLATTALALFVGVVAALTVSKRTSRATPLIRSIYLIPTALPLFTTAYLWRSIVLPHSGLLDSVRRGLGLGRTANQLLVGHHSFLALVVIDLWFAWGFVYLFAMAGLQSVPEELYEAAELDGASSWQKVRYVLYPGLKKVLAIAAVLSTLNHYNDFTLPYVLFGTSPPNGVAVLPTVSYEAAYSVYNFGLADAVAVLGVIAIAVPMIVYIRFTFSSRRS